MIIKYNTQGAYSLQEMLVTLRIRFKIRDLGKFAHKTTFV